MLPSAVANFVPTASARADDLRVKRENVSSSEKLSESTDASGAVADGPRGKSAHRWITTSRRIFAFIAAIAGSGLALASYWVHNLQVCRPASGGTAKFPVAAECGPWTYSDLTPFVLAALACLVPDFSELSVASLLTLKREINLQKQELSIASRRQEALESIVTSQIVSLQSAQSNNLFFHLGDLRGLVSRVEDKAGAYASDESGVEAPTHDDSTSSNESAAKQIGQHTEAELRIQLIEIWENLRRYIDGAFRRRSPSSLPLTERQQEIVERWYSVFQEEINSVRAARNSVAHAMPLGIDELKATVEAARRLEEYLMSEL